LRNPSTRASTGRSLPSTRGSTARSLPSTRDSTARSLRASAGALVAMMLFVGAGAAQRSTAPAKLIGGTGTLYIGGWPNKIFMIDEATEKVTGAIEATTGTPARATLSKDRR